MSIFLCKLWPYLAGGLIGWLLAGWFARRLKHSEPSVERVVEKQVDKIVDNPKHLALISKLEGENKQIPDLMTKLAGFESSKPKTVEKIVEKLVDNPEHLAQIKKLEADNKEVSKLRTRIKSFENQTAKVVETKVDSPELLARIKTLEEENGQVSNLQGKIKELEGSSARIVELEGQVKKLRRGSAVDLKAAKVAGIAISNETDFTAIEGIGPKINDLIHGAGIKTFRQLADTPVSEVQTILDKAGSSYKIANPGTWPDQASLVTNNRWSALKALQDILDGGVYPTNKSAKVSSSKSSAKKSPKKPTAIKLDTAAAKAAGFKLKQNNGQDDFTLVEGIGPKINELIHADGIHTFAELAAKAVDAIQAILDKAGARYKLAKPGTWPAQAEMAANNKWDELKKWQDELDGGE